METSNKTIVFGVLGITLITAALLVYSPQTAVSTGCPTNFVGEYIQSAKLVLENGDKEEVMSQLQQAEEAIGMISEEEE